MLLSTFFEKRRKKQIKEAFAEGFAQGKAAGEAKVLREFAEQIENAKGDPQAEAKVFEACVERLGHTKSVKVEQQGTLIRANFSKPGRVPGNPFIITY